MATTKSIILDAKQINMIQKLIRLANNNPNDNEANVAARRACKLLDGYLFPVTQQSNVKPASNPTSPHYDPFEDLFRRARQQAADAAKKEQHRQNYNPFVYDEHNPFWTEFGKSYNTQGKAQPGSTKQAKQGPTETTSKPHADGPKKDPFAEYKEEWYAEASPFYNEYYDEFKKSKERKETYNATIMSEAELEVFLRHGNWDRSINKRILYCARCNKNVSTGYPGDAYVFVCIDCELKTAKKRG
jgi:hypothetical protein